MNLLTGMFLFIFSMFVFKANCSNQEVKGISNEKDKGVVCIMAHTEKQHSAGVKLTVLTLWSSYMTTLLVMDS